MRDQQSRGNASRPKWLIWPLAVVVLLSHLNMATALTEKDILVRLYKLASGSKWENNYGWEEGTQAANGKKVKVPPLCSWFGILCVDDNGSIDMESDEGVVVINLVGNQLEGQITKDLYSMPSLTDVDLTHNQITDAGLEGLGSGAPIEKLVLTKNRLASLSGIENAPDTLQDLQISENGFTKFPPGVLALTELKYLIMTYNGGISGPIPKGLSKMKNLRKLLMFANSFTGTIPSELSELKKLEELSLDENKLTGTLPPELGQLYNLNYLSIQNVEETSGNLTGELPRFENLVYLQELYLDHNSISGIIPEKFLSNSNVTDKHCYFSLDHNILEGTIPKHLSRFKKLKLDVRENQFTEIPNHLCKMKLWMNGRVEKFGCDAILCPAGTYAYAGRQENANESCQPCPNGESGAPFLGAVDCLDAKGGQKVYIDNNGNDQQILVKFALTLNLDKWKHSEGWKDDLASVTSVEETEGLKLDYCNWYGVTCTRSGEVTKLDLPNNQLKGIVPNMFFKLSELKSLDLSHNQVTLDKNGGFGSVWEAKKLRTLNLNDTPLVSWEGLEAATTLEELSITDNALVGPFPDELLQLTKLKRLKLSFSGISGTLPEEIKKLSSLEVLNLYGNYLTGTVPSGIGKLTRLVHLDFSENSFEGSIPAEINGLKHLEFLAFHKLTNDSKGLTGRLPSFDDLPKLSALLLNSNSLEGPIPDNFLAGISDKSKKIIIGIGFNQLTGVIPSSLASFDAVQLEAVGNQFLAIDDAFCSKSDWQSGEVGASGNSCDAILCPIGTYSIYGMSSPSLNSRCEVCPDAKYMGTTQCTANAVEDKAKYTEKKILDDFYLSTGGPNWISAINWTDSGVGVCDYEGIKCKEGSHEDGGVTDINLAEMALSGSIPSSIWNLPHLQVLNIAHNPVDPNFKYIGDAKKLKVLNVAGTNPNVLDGLENTPSSLIELYLESLDLEGTIPEVLWTLSQLRVLRMDFNHFTGTLSNNISKLKKLHEFGCSANDLTGTIPSGIGKLSKLKGLMLGKNKLSGFLPDELGSLGELEMLSLKTQRGKNKLSGPLPDFASNTKLHTLDLSNNSIKSHIPSSLLSGVDETQDTSINFANNHLKGSLPASLARFDELFLDVTGNQITGVPSILCENSDWMNGAVGNVLKPCDAILCPKGYFNGIGRMEEDSEPCSPCKNLEQDAPYFGSTHCGSSERGILMELFQLLGGNDWRKTDNWNDEKVPICKWYGIGCKNGRVDSDEGVISIKLPGNGLFGGESISQIFSSLFWSLPHLKELDIKDNAVSISFEGIGDASNLETLFLSSNGITDIYGIGQATNLKILHLTDNLLKVPLADTELFQLKELQSLYLSYNGFYGTLPSSIGRLSKLKEFWSYKNMLTGQLPTEIGLLSELEYLTISENMLSGTIPFELNKLTKLKDLALFNQRGNLVQLHGPIPDFAASPQLSVIALGDNQLSGSIPDTLLSTSNVKDQRIRIGLANNLMTGVVPTSLNAFDNLALEITGNKIEKIPGKLCNHGKWMDGVVGSVGSCAAIACPPWTWSSSGRQMFPNEQCEPCLGASGPYIGGTSCANNGREKTILEDLYKSTGGDNWAKKLNWMNEKIPICSWDLVFCGNGNDREDHGIIRLDLESNNLRGTIPSSIFDLPYLEELNLKWNTEVRFSFEGIWNALNLKILYLSEVKIDSMNGIGAAPALKTLHLTGCGISGPFPKEIANLAPTLEQLYVAYNDFTGTLPTEFGMLQHLTDFYAYSNEFSGRIPSQIGEMSSLQNLVLSENLLSGQIPSEIGSMTNLGLFSCFRRVKKGPKLSGNLPSFANNPKLTDLYLDHNNIRGSIPSSFLFSSTQMYLVNLASNDLTGTIPKDLSNLNPFQIELEGNKLSKVPAKMCENELWQAGDVADYGCDAILCPAGYYSKYGRQNSTDSACTKCTGDTDITPYMGSFSCDGESDRDESSPKEERDILMEFFGACGGSSWHRRSKWGSAGVHLCDWDGIICTYEKTVQSIHLGANNIVGTPPASLFDLPDLGELWLYSNPITFRFDNIARAKGLYSLRLDSTNLASVSGIGSAPSLEFLDLRFNRLKGRFPKEILSLETLKTLSMGDNFLSGPLPTSDEWARLHFLTELRLGVNKLSGPLPDFAFNVILTYVDISHNDLSGKIPSTFLTKVSSSNKILIDLADNGLSGPIPDQLDKFLTATLFLRNNKIDAVPESLCDDQDDYAWMKGGVSKYGCDAILCPPGTYNDMGRRSVEVVPCTQCMNGPSLYYGQTQCGVRASAATSATNCSLVTVLVLGLAYILQAFS